jgi:hypothetical protein
MLIFYRPVREEPLPRERKRDTLPRTHYLGTESRPFLSVPASPDLSESWVGIGSLFCPLGGGGSPFGPSVML